MNLGRLAPLILVACALLDLGLRALPPHYLAFRGWEAALNLGGHDAPFAPLRSYSAPAYGDLANLGNLPAARRYRAETFSTDRFGFRNLDASIDRGGYAGMVIGDSFAVGAALSDHETLAQQLGRELGAPVYNAGGIGADSRRVLRQADRISLRRGFILYLLYELTEVPSTLRDGRLARYPALKRARQMGAQLLAYSPLQVVTTRLFRRLENGSIFPNHSGAAVTTATLANGESMLFLSAERFRGSTPPSAFAESVRTLADAADKQGLRLVVAFVPSKQTIYGAFSKDKVPDTGGRTALMAEELRAMARSGISVLDLTETLAAGARVAWPDRYVFLLDDTHWNAEGVGLAARFLAPHLRRDTSEGR